MKPYPSATFRERERESLPGVLPPEILDLQRNYLNGTVPKEWGTLEKLETLFLTGNRLSGQFPEEIGNISTLKRLQLGFNQFTGPFPAKLGDIAGINTIEIQANGLEGPIPSEISVLEKLETLKISDLNGKEGSFPFLQNMKKLNILVMRSCNINGTLPDYLGSMGSIRNLDLSFNKLAGEIPSTFAVLSNVQFMYLTGNLLTGPLPSWMCNRRVNNITGIPPCMKSLLSCRPDRYSFNINCGGREVIGNDKTKYDADLGADGPSKFYQSTPNYWAASSTGDFTVNGGVESYTSDISANNLSPMINSELYLTLPFSPLSNLLRVLFD
ncbi:hypothetical protein MKX03_018183 [Papaver bracteatum]|nr:hypothetical protein MKX03_018183 [Papaver bracteatum]